MPADTNRKTEIRTAPAPGNCRTAPTEGRRKAAAEASTWRTPALRRRLKPALRYWNDLANGWLRHRANLPVLPCSDQGAIARLRRRRDHGLAAAPAAAS